MRAGFDALGVDGAGQPDAGALDGTPLPDGAVFISPTGDDNNVGSQASPWRTWSHALSQLSPGDTLVALDGVYGAASGTGYFRVDCGSSGTLCAGGPCANGTAKTPISVMAHNERAAFLKAEMGAGLPFLIQSCHHWEIRGLRVENIDDAKSTMKDGYPILVEDSQAIKLSRMLAGKPNRYFNTKVCEISGSTDVVVEECEVYDFHRSALIAYRSEKIVFRRNYVNGRFAKHLPGSIFGDCGHALLGAENAGISIYGADRCIVENNVVENTCNAFKIIHTSGQGDDNVLVGNMAVGAFKIGHLMTSNCGNLNPCVAETRILRGNTITDDVAVGGNFGFYNRGSVETSVSHLSALGYTNTGLRSDLSPDNAGLAASIDVTASLAASTGSIDGFSMRDNPTFTLTHCNSHGNATDYYPATAKSSNSSYDPQLGGCYVYIPPGSPGKGAGPSGSDVGANIVFRSENGKPTSEKLWDQATGRFPCGAVVAGVNDDVSFPDSACVNVHRRLHVGSSGCPIP